MISIFRSISTFPPILDKRVFHNRQCIKNILNNAGMFYGCLLPNVTTSKCGECVVEINSELVVLYVDAKRSDVIIQWPIKCIRRYHHEPKEKRVKIEAGR